MGELPVRPVLPRRSTPAYRPFRIRARAFTPAQCRRIVALGSALPAERGRLLDGEEDRAPGARAHGTEGRSLRVSATAWLSPAPETQWIFERLARAASWANRHYGFDLTGFDEDLQFTTYDRPGAHYTWHQDGLDAGVSHRKLSIVVQLTDPDTYRGGDLEFLETAEDYDQDMRADYLSRSRRLGAAVVFPSFEFHRVVPVTSGIRHSLVAWVSGPPFR